MKKIYTFIFILVLSLGFFSCGEDYLDELPRNILTSDNLYLTPSGFENGLNAIYALVRQERSSYGSNNCRSAFANAGTDDYYMARYNVNDAIFGNWGSYMHSQSLGLSENWSWLYRIINSANTIIDRADNPDLTWESEAQKNGVVAQARCIRAWAYRHLTFCWGDVPLSLNESTGNNVRTDWERTPVAKVREAMESDWLFAEQHLPDVHTLPGRVNKAVAQHYLAELYLTMGEPANAEAKAGAVVDNPNYALITERYGIRMNQPGVPFMDQFYDGNVLRVNGNKEVLWEFPYDRDVQGGGSNVMRRVWLTRYSAIPGISVSPARGRGSNFMAGTDHAFNLYEGDDDRNSHFAIHHFVVKDNGDTLFTRLGDVPEAEVDNYRPSTAKWDDGDPDNPAAGEGYHDQPYLRLAETYLLLAEAQLVQDKKEEAAATLNVVRQRSNASPVLPDDVTIDYILDERTRELFTEEHRRYTLLRLNKWLERTRAFNSQCGPKITERDVLYPIPQDVIDANLDAVFPQNPLY